MLIDKSFISISEILSEHQLCFKASLHVLILTGLCVSAQGHFLNDAI